jgi:hypothetical protein
MVADKTIVSSADEGFTKIRENEKAVYMDEHPYSMYVVQQKPCDLVSGWYWVVYHDVDYCY